MYLKKREYNGAVHKLYVDLRKAYDSVRREVLYNVLTEFGIPVKLLRFKKCVEMKLIVKCGWASVCLTRSLLKMF